MIRQIIHIFHLKHDGLGYVRTYVFQFTILQRHSYSTWNSIARIYASHITSSKTSLLNLNSVKILKLMNPNGIFYARLINDFKHSQYKPVVIRQKMHFY